VRAALDRIGRVGNRGGKATADDERKVGKIVADMRALVRGKAELGAQRLPWPELVICAHDDVRDRQVAGAFGDAGGRRCR